ncbi:unnamed protein product [Orchesella dallaii]|uniref:Gustatory receptor n=1 Tax=Orchesella dallaii TaxID=48710 RepID=A0ABP1RTC2_9HEXA
MYVVVFAIGFFSCTFTAASFQSVPVHLVAIGAMFGAFSIMAWASAFIIIRHPYELVNGINSFAALHQRFDNYSSGYLSEINPVIENFWKLVSIGVTLAVVQFAVISCQILAIFPLVEFPLDPFFITIPIIIPASTSCRSTYSCSLVYDIVIWCSRYVISMVSTTTCCRFFAMLLVTFAYMFEIQSRYLDTLNRLPFGNGVNMKFFKWYRALQIANQRYQEPVSWIFCIMLSDGFVVSVLCNVVSLKRYGLPIEVYILAPTVSVLTIFFAMVFLSVAIQSEVISKKLIRKRSTHLGYAEGGSFELKLLRRLFKSLRPVALRCGSFMNMESGMDRTFLVGICSRTVDAFLLLM